MGILSDGLPLFGYNKRSYLFIVSTLSMAAFAVIVFIPERTLGATFATLSFFVIFWQIAMADLLTEAKYAEQIKRHPDHGPSLISYVWGGIFGASIISAGTIGLMFVPRLPIRRGRLSASKSPAISRGYIAAHRGC